MHLNSLLKTLLVTATGALLGGSAHDAPTMKRCLAIGHSPFRVAEARDPACWRTLRPFPAFHE